MKFITFALHTITSSRIEHILTAIVIVFLLSFICLFMYLFISSCIHILVCIFICLSIIFSFRLSISFIFYLFISGLSPYFPKLLSSISAIYVSVFAVKYIILTYDYLSRFMILFS